MVTKLTMIMNLKMFFRNPRDNSETDTEENFPQAEANPAARRQSYLRKKVETSFSRITGLFPKTIHAVSSKGFVLKVISFILVFAIQSL